MDDIQRLLTRQAVWQRSRQSLSWPEKIRLAEMVRESVQQLRASFPPEGKHKISPRRQS